MTGPGRTIAICDMDFYGPIGNRILPDADIAHVHNGGMIA